MAEILKERPTENIVNEELARSEKRLNLDEESGAVLKAMLSSIVSKLNHEPICFLKRRFDEDAGSEYIGIVRRLFDLDKDSVPQNAHADRKHE